LCKLSFLLPDFDFFDRSVKVFVVWLHVIQIYPSLMQVRQNQKFGRFFQFLVAQQVNLPMGRQADNRHLSKNLISRAHVYQIFVFINKLSFCDSGFLSFDHVVVPKLVDLVAKVHVTRTKQEHLRPNSANDSSISHPTNSYCFV
jgi:hypothetical protein